MSRLPRDGTAEPVSRDQTLRREHGQGNIHFPRSADHEQDWQSYSVDPYSCCMCDHIYNDMKGVTFSPVDLIDVWHDIVNDLTTIISMP